MHRTKPIVLFALVVLAAAMATHASTFLAMDQAELTAASSVVVQGEVVETQSFWDETGRVIVTEAVVVVDEVVAGRAPREVRVRTFGGEVAGYHVDAIGFPRFEAGQQVLLFLQPGDGETLRGTEVLRVTGYQLGQYHIKRGATGEWIAVPALDSDVTLLGAGGRAVAAPEPVPLTALKSRVRTTWQALESSR